MARKKIDPTKEREEILGRYDAEKKALWDSRRGERFDYTPLPVDHGALLDQFDRKREERASEAARNAEYKNLAKTILDQSGDSLYNILAVKEVTPDPRFSLGRGVAPYKTPGGEETPRAWDELLETIQDWMSSDEFAKAKPEFERRLENLLEAVRLDWNSATCDTVANELDERGYV